MVSVTRRIEGSGGKMYSFWAVNSLRMSFWSVPASWERWTPIFSAAATYIAQVIAAGEEAHGPEPAAVHRLVDAAGVGELAGRAEVPVVVEAAPRQVVGCVDLLHHLAGGRHEVLGRLAQPLRPVRAGDLGGRVGRQR